MLCPKCGAENREGSNYCRYCSTPLAAKSSEPNSGYIPSVPPPGTQQYGIYHPPQNYQQAPQPPARPVVGQLICPRCGSPNVVKGGTPLWATLTAIIGFFFICVFSLFFLLVKEPHRCLNCGLEFK
ncbi:MAG TPA: zinc-ribbon domain-containing protein [Blastocatellia bacterium]|nr:zinc-ribbon domain-containing protein [Blastocatellia bacterium]